MIRRSFAFWLAYGGQFLVINSSAFFFELIGDVWDVSRTRNICVRISAPHMTLLPIDIPNTLFLYIDANVGRWR